jgi:hypothetical protein
MLVLKRKSDLTVDILHWILLYDSAGTGDFIWLAPLTRNSLIGQKAGVIDDSGYVRVGIGRLSFMAHRLAWFYMRGEWPPTIIDHRDLNKSNNRWSNLRLADDSTNKQNTRVDPRNVSGLKGVTLFKGRYQSRIQLKSGKRLWLGSFETPQEAHAAYRDAAVKHFGEFARF